ncbi:DUF58 domain-containing protein [Verrucomicrobiaceae bacterium R5-34]|nr:DUF58 domain-containing protein [Verrucomicrobiaceae bacterium R5-34]
MTKKRIPLSTRGAALAGGSAALLAGGMVMVDGFLMVLGFSGIVFLIVAWGLGKLSLRGLEVQLQMPVRVSAGIPCELELTLLNHRNLLDAFQTELMLFLPGSGGGKNRGSRVEAVAPWTASGSASRVSQQVTLRGRGFAELHPVIITCSFPLGLFRMSKRMEIRRELTITPRPIVPLELNSDGSMHDAVPRSGSSAGHAFGEPRGIRPWQAGDSARHIHWAASARALARGHSLRVREYDPPGFHPDHCHVVFHSFATGGEMLREDRFERALSLLAGTLTELQGNGIPCMLTADFNDWQPALCTTRAQLVECLCRLARIRRARGTEAHDLEQALRAVSPEHTLMIISDMSPESWQHLLSKHPHTLIVDIRQVKYRNRSLHALVG